MHHKILLAILPSKTGPSLAPEDIIATGLHPECTLETCVIIDPATPENTYSKLPQDIEKLYLQVVFPLGKIHKIIFEYAKTKQYDYVVLADQHQYRYLHSCLPKISNYLQNGVPYITAGNKIPVKLGLVNFIQRKVFKKSLNLFPLICIYKTDYLAKIPYLFNSDEATFINEIAIQFILSDFEYQELQSDTYVPIPYKTKWKTIGVFLSAYLHTLGIFHQNKFDIVKDNLQYSLKLGYASSHAYAINAVPPGAKVIDIGAGPYGVGHELKKKDCTVVTVDQYDIPEHFKLDKHVIADLNKNFSVPIQEYDCILFLDILEHIVYPEQFLFQISEQMGYRKQKVILTTGNIAFLPLRIMLLLGYFNYGKSGILDKTHTRLFTFNTFKKLVTDSGLKITKISGIPAPYPKAIGNHLLSNFLLAINTLAIRAWRSLFSYQILIEAESVPSVLYVAKEMGKGKETQKTIN